MNYWPKLHSTEDYGMVKVTHLYTDSYVSYEIRTFEANVGTENKRVSIRKLYCVLTTYMYSYIEICNCVNLGHTTGIYIVAR